MYKSTTELKVRYAETDQMGIVHHSNYYVYFETAREDFILGAGISYKEIEDKGIMMPLVETQCRYIEGAKYADELIIETSLQELSPVKVVLEYKVIRVKDGRLISKGKTIQTFVDSDSFKIVNLKKANADLWERFERLK
ncbi:acyl-CoA thioester hydrolase, YbgC/YbaW family [Clostridiales bacterium oral taxon 876 str. F0540]|nr:acyl-CoA thioester hydrolase, YbgC/YbaW family [Clostridiales bacterium oral taxon 876 str. F0540]